MTTPAPDAHPADLVAALIGSTQITLGGFGATSMPRRVLRPGLMFVPADASPSVTDMDVRTRRSLMRLVHGFSIGLGLSAALAAGFWFGVANGSPHAGAAVLDGSWSVEDVSAQGVVMRAEGVVTLVPTGSKLPNGEQLQAVIPSRHTYVTDHATVIVQTPTLIEGGNERRQTDAAAPKAAAEGSRQ